MKCVSVSLQNYKSLIREYISNNSLSDVNYEEFIAKIEAGITDDMSSLSLASYCGEQAASMITRSPQYGKLAAVISISYHNSVTLDSFSDKLILIKSNTQILNNELFEFVINNRETFDSMLDYSRDFDLSFFAMNSLIKSYLIKINGVTVERPQDLFMRTAIQINRDDFSGVKKTYDLLSLGYYTHGTPTLFNSMLEKHQLASCFLLAPKGDSIEGIFATLGDCALISKYSGGLGLSLHNIRSKGALLKSSNGYSNGIVPVIKIMNETMKYVNHGGTKRQSTIAFYLEPWHKDIFDFLDIRKNTGNEEMRAREVFNALWVNDLFMERVENDEIWSLFDPSDAKHLSDVHGDEFRSLYLKYEETISRVKVRAQYLFKAIINSQIETGSPYMLYKDTCNKHSNQKNLGTIKSSNLCAEIIEFTSPEETAVCNLASICLPKFVENGIFNYKKLCDVVKIVCHNLNRNIDAGFYPTPEANRSNLRHRPIGIGVQGLADVFFKLKLPFESEAAKSINKLISETMYFGALEASVDLAKIYGPYESFPDSPLSQGIFHFESYGVTPSGMWDFDALRVKLMQYGARNSLLIALMPTAGTSQLYGNSECFEPLTSNIFTRRTIAGEFQVINSYLVNDLMRLSLWSEEMRNLIIEHEGSIQNIPIIPMSLKNLYKTVWEIKMKSIIDMAADRQPFIDQSQSLNIFLSQPTFGQVSSMHFYGWKRGLKTGLYYLRTRPISSSIKFTVDQEMVLKTLSSMQGNDSPEDENEEYCEACSC